MARIALTLVAAPALLLGACEIDVGKDQDQAKVEVAAPAGEDGRVSISTPGFEMKVALPDGISISGSGDRGGMLYPGARMSGLNIEAGGKAGEGVDIRFNTSDSIDRVAAWYRDTARASEFAIDSARRDGGAIMLAGRDADDDDPFTLRLEPGGEGGTRGILTVGRRN